MIKIIGGIKKRTTIQVPLTNVRPTSVQKRESIFSIIESYRIKNNQNTYEKINVLDLFAGSGALGLEAISRGAYFGYFYENNIDVIHVLNNNCKKICRNNNFEIKKGNILKSNFEDIQRKISLVFIDPPYKLNPFEKVLKNINQSKILCKNAIIILECSIILKIKFPSFLSCLNERNYGKTKIYFLINNIN